MITLRDIFSRGDYPDAEIYDPTEDDWAEYAAWLVATQPPADEQLPTAEEIAARFAAAGEADPFL